MSPSYADRAALPTTAPLTAYLLQLISAKKTNVAVSAEVESAAALLELADAVGPAICLLRVDATAIRDFRNLTVRHLREIARRRGFLVYECSGASPILDSPSSFSIVQWAELVTHPLAPAASPARLAEEVAAIERAASKVCSADLLGIHTHVTAGQSAEPDQRDTISVAEDVRRLFADSAEGELGRKASTVSVSTTISRTTAETGAAPALVDAALPCQHEALARIGRPPASRGLLLPAWPGPGQSGPDHAALCRLLLTEVPGFVVGLDGATDRAVLDGADSLLWVAAPVGGDRDSASADAVGQVERGMDVVVLSSAALGPVERAAETVEAVRKAAWGAYERR